MLRTIQNFFDFIAPPTAEKLRLRLVNVDSMAHYYNPQSVFGATALNRYQEPVIQAAIIATKFQHNPRAAALLATSVNQWLHSNPLATEALWVPIPLATQREKDRGYNQVQWVLEKSDLPKTQLTSNLLIKDHDTTPQSKLSREQRLINLQGVFSLTQAAAVTGRHIVICDDVITTGATMAAARAALAPHSPASITCLAFAH